MKNARNIGFTIIERDGKFSHIVRNKSNPKEKKMSINHNVPVIKITEVVPATDLTKIEVGEDSVSEHPLRAQFLKELSEAISLQDFETVCVQILLEDKIFSDYVTFQYSTTASHEQRIEWLKTVVAKALTDNKNTTPNNETEEIEVTDINNQTSPTTKPIELETLNIEADKETQQPNGIGNDPKQEEVNVNKQPPCKVNNTWLKTISIAAAGIVVGVGGVLAYNRFIK